MESLDRERARRVQAQSNQNRFESPKIKSVADIKYVLSKLEPNVKHPDDVTLSVNMSGIDTNNQNQTFHVSAQTKTNSLRDVILSGLDVVLRREKELTKVSDSAPIVIDGKEMKAPSIISENAFSSVDPIIAKSLGGYRNGHYIQWDLSDGYTYQYDIYAHRLTKFSTNEK